MSSSVPTVAGKCALGQRTEGVGGERPRSYSSGRRKPRRCTGCKGADGGSERASSAAVLWCSTDCRSAFREVSVLVVFMFILSVALRATSRFDWYTLFCRFYWRLLFRSAAKLLWRHSSSRDSRMLYPVDFAVEFNWLCRSTSCQKCAAAGWTSWGVRTAEGLVVLSSLCTASAVASFENDQLVDFWPNCCLT